MTPTQTPSAPAVPNAIPVDFEAIKARQQSMWGSGDFGVIAAMIHPSAERLVEAADLRAGASVLDVATGTGNAAIAAARSGCQVVGVDYVPALLERGRERAHAERLPVEFVVGDAEALPFPAERFDAVLSIFGVMFAPDQPRAARELMRVSRPGAKVALASWTPAGFVGQMLKTVTRHVPPPAGVSSPVLWGTEARLRELFGDCVSSLTARPTEVVFRFRSPEEYVEVFRRFYGPVLKAFETVGAAGAPALYADLVALAREFDRGGGAGVAIPAQYLEVVAVRA